jgi:hypothetical protein
LIKRLKFSEVLYLVVSKNKTNILTLEHVSSENSFFIKNSQVAREKFAFIVVKRNITPLDEKLKMKKLFESFLNV